MACTGLAVTYLPKFQDCDWVELSHPPWLTFVAGICGTKYLWNTSCFQTAEQTWTNSSGWGLVSHGLCWLKLVLSGAALTNRYRGQLRERLHRAGKDEAALSHLLCWANRNLSLIFNKSVFSRTEVIPNCSYCFPLALLVSYVSHIQGHLILAYQCLKGFMKRS